MPKKEHITNYAQELFGEKAEVHISIGLLSSEDGERYLKRDLIEMGYRPVELTIENGSPDPYRFSEESIDLPLVGGKAIADKIRKSALPRSILAKIAGFFFPPIGILGSVDSLVTSKRYRKLKKELESKSVREETIPPYSTVRRVFFLSPEALQDSFAVRLENEETLETKTFPVTDFLTGSKQTVEALPTVSENYYLTHG